MTTQPPLTAEALRQLADAIWAKDQTALASYHYARQAVAEALRYEAARLTSPAPSPAGGGDEQVSHLPICRKCLGRIGPLEPRTAVGVGLVHLTCPLASAPPPAGERTQALRQRLMMFYQVNTTDELIAIQDRHIERLQAKLRQHSDEPLAMRRVREG